MKSINTAPLNQVVEIPKNRPRLLQLLLFGMDSAITSLPQTHELTNKLNISDPVFYEFGRGDLKQTDWEPYFYLLNNIDCTEVNGIKKIAISSLLSLYLVGYKNKRQQEQALLSLRKLQETHITITKSNDCLLLAPLISYLLVDDNFIYYTICPEMNKLWSAGLWSKEEMQIRQKIGRKSIYALWLYALSTSLPDAELGLDVLQLISKYQYSLKLFKAKLSETISYLTDINIITASIETKSTRNGQGKIDYIDFKRGAILDI